MASRLGGLCCKGHLVTMFAMPYAGHSRHTSCAARRRRRQLRVRRIGRGHTAGGAANYTAQHAVGGCNVAVAWLQPAALFPGPGCSAGTRHLPNVYALRSDQVKQVFRHWGKLMLCFVDVSSIKPMFGMSGGLCGLLVLMVCRFPSSYLRRVAVRGTEAQLLFCGQLLHDNPVCKYIHT